ncbi:MAG: sigma-70 family RNA polymerase sigma factor [Chloroflexi bacterium]|nr:sigma-70 family RNA polymerase sigma factor [Chloroflexota bacterium]
MAEPSPSVVWRAQQGDKAALVELVTSQQSYLYSIALGVVGNPADAADVTQDAAIRLLRSLSTYRGETRFTTWLYRLVVNLALDHLRRRGHRETSLDQEPGEGYYEVEDTDPLVDPLVHLDRQETAARVRSALARLPAVQRAALTMYYFDDMPYEEIARALGLPLNTLKSHLRRARQRMAQLLDEREVAWTVAT